MSKVFVYNDPATMKVIVRGDGEQKEFTIEEWSLICRAASEDLWDRLENMKLYIAMKDKPSKEDPQ